jgi:hypothetical protein
MKTRELIRQLQQADPSGELECCVDNHDIHFVRSQEAYWDGRLQVLARDPAKAPYYNVVGAKITAKGSKVVIVCLSIEDALCNDPSMPVDLSEANDRDGHYAAQVDSWRAEAIGSLSHDD